MCVHLFNWPVSTLLGRVDPVKITASGGVLNFNVDKKIRPSFVDNGSGEVCDLSQF